MTRNLRESNRGTRVGARVRLAGIISLLLPACGEATSTQAPNVVLITVESLRPDHMASFGGPRCTSPRLDALADEAVFYPDAHAVTSWTLSSHASLFTGLYPTAHQTTGPLSKLGESYTTIAESLTDRGYTCAGFVSGPYLRKHHELDQGFSIFDDSAAEATSAAGHSDVTNGRMHELTSRFIESRRGSKEPFFLFGYYWDPHYDYIPPAPYDAEFVDAECEPIDVAGYETAGLVTADITPAQLRFVEAQYDGEIKCTDETLGQLFDLLRREGLWDNTLVIITSDHGEEFFDHGEKGHKHNLYAESVHVPLIIKYPGARRSGVDPRLVSLVDIYPTILEITDIGGSEHLHGESLCKPDPDPARSIYFELLSRWYFPKPGGGTDARDENFIAIRRGDHKLIKSSSKERVELFDVRADPSEQTDLFSQRTARAQRLFKDLSSWRADMQAIADFHAQGGDAEITGDALERLRALGYVR